MSSAAHAVSQALLDHLEFLARREAVDSRRTAALMRMDDTIQYTAQANHKSPMIWR